MYRHQAYTLENKVTSSVSMARG